MDKNYKSRSEPKRKSRSRSRSPLIEKEDEKRRHEKERKHKHRHHHYKRDGKRRSRSTSSDSSSSDERSKKEKNIPPPPAPKISMNFNKSASASSSGSKSGIQIKLGGVSQLKAPPLIQKTTKINSVFNADDDSEPEEMPAEAKMRMRNIGKDTPTSSGPNSFGKTKQGFIDSKKIFERKLKQMADELTND